MATRFGNWTTWVVLALSCAAWSAGLSVARADDDEGDNDDKVPLTVPKAVCGPEDHPETALQGQVPAALRATGFKGFNCNLKLVGQSRGDGANWQSAEFKDHHGHVCGYHGTAFNTRCPTTQDPTGLQCEFLQGQYEALRTHLGVPVIDVTDENHPRPTAYLDTTSMQDPWESLKVNERRRLLGADSGHNGGGGPEVDIYDISRDCRSPQLLASMAVAPSDGSLIGHEGSWAPDGLTYYGGDLRNAQYYAVDTTNPREPKLITKWKPGIANVHGLSISDDGRRGYFVSLGFNAPADVGNPAVAATNGLLIYDISQIQDRKANPQVRLISKLLWKDGSVAQHTIPIRIDEKPYLIFVDEGGPGGGTSPAQQAAAHAAGMPLFPLARIIDISDETNPKIVSRLALEIHDPANYDKVQPDLVGLSIFTYGSHYCSVDNKHHATTLACGYFNSGIRVFDIRNPKRPREIAYYNPAGTTTVSPGSNHTIANNWVAGSADWCSAQTHLDAKRGTLWTTCQDNGLLMLKFERGVWPFEDSSTPPGQQN